MTVKKPVALALAAALIPAPLARGAAEKSEPGAGCEEPTPQRSYDAETFTFGISLDLSGCGWWDGGPAHLSAELTRFDGVSEEGSLTITLCRAFDPDQEAADEPDLESQKPSQPPHSPRAPEPEARPAVYAPRSDSASPGDRPGVARPGVCDVSTSIGHLPVEGARYSGEVIYPWSDGPRSVGFEALCVSTGTATHCQDVASPPGPAATRRHPGDQR